MVNILLGAVISGMVTFTIARSLVYDFYDEDNNHGPLPIPGLFVQPIDGGQTRAANLFDLIRKFFGMYTVQRVGKSQFWRPNLSYALGVWACRHCLGFWIAIAVNFFCFSGSLIERFLVVFGAATINTLLISVEVIANGTKLREMQWEDSPHPEPEESTTVP